MLLEIGTEEIPSDYLDNGIRALKRLAESYLMENRIKVEGRIDSHGTPRRLVLVGSDVAEKQDDAVQEMTGPPKKVAFDEDGNPTKAALGFAQKQGVSVDYRSSGSVDEKAFLLHRPELVTSEHLSRLIG